MPPFQTLSCIPGCLDHPELLIFLSLPPMLRPRGSTTMSGVCGTEDHTQDFVYARNALTLYQLSYIPCSLLFCILNKCKELTIICNLIHLKRFIFNFKLCVCVCHELAFRVQVSTETKGVWSFWRWYFWLMWAAYRFLIIYASGLTKPSSRLCSPTRLYYYCIILLIYCFVFQAFKHYLKLILIL